jgi:hypothetical protein
MKVRMNAGDQNRTSAMAAPAADGGMARRSTISESMRSDGRAAAPRQQTQRSDSESCAQLPACDCQHLISGLGSIYTFTRTPRADQEIPGPPPSVCMCSLSPRAGPRFPFAADSESGNGDSLFPARFPIPVNRETGFTGSPRSEKEIGKPGVPIGPRASPTRSRESDFLSDEHQLRLRLPVQLSRVPRGPWARPQAGAQAT